jgi:cytochrome c-type biogenesis protein CcmH
MRGLIVVLALIASPAFAVQPSEILSDPMLEARARSISQQLRCPVCQGENIDDSSAPISRDLRVAVRERLVAGDSDDDVIRYVVTRFGEFVLFNPRAEGSGLLLWLAGPMMLVAGAGIALLTNRRRQQIEPSNLTPEDQKRLADILRE